MSTFTTDQLLDLDGIGQRASTFRFDLLDSGGAVIGAIEPDASRVPTIENNVNRGIKRDLRDLLLAPADAAAVNPISDRVRPLMVLENGVELAWGLFLFVDGSTAPQTMGTWFTGSMFDFCFILDQPLPESVGYGAGQSIATALAGLFEGAGITDYFIDTFTTTTSQPIVWPAGTSRLQVMNDLAAMAGCYSVFFDNAGQGRVELVPDLATAAATVTYSLGANIYDGSILETDNLLSAPNQYIVIDSAATAVPIVGVYDVPDSAPHSALNRGFVVARVLNEQGLADVAAANARGAAAAAQDAADYKWVSFASAPDPRHDTFDIVDLLGVRYREQRWSCPLAEGAVCAHDLRRIY